MCPFALASRTLAITALASLLGALCGSCTQFDDCEIYGTCADSLRDIAVEKLRAAGPRCEECWTNDGHCGKLIERCSQDAPCNFAARCMLTTDPGDYQQCIEVLSEHYSDGSGNKPFEGGVDEDNDFMTCIDHCSSVCFDPLRWACRPPPTFDPNLSRKARVAVRVYPFSTVPDCVHVQACSDEGPCAESGKTLSGEDVDVELDLPAGSLDAVYFKLESDEKCLERLDENDRIAFKIPATRFYPGYLSHSKVQPVAIFVVSEQHIGISNASLLYGNDVLRRRGQSLILPDSCVWENISAPGVRFSVAKTQKEEPIAQCHEIEPCDCDLNDEGCDCPACIWYSARKLVNRDSKQTDGTGGGAVGIEPGTYLVEVRAADDPSTVYSKRTFTVERGEMVVLRTWPNQIKREASP